MSNLNNLHNEAMDYAERALIARNGRDYDAAAKLFEKSLELEMAALQVIEQLPRVEPTYSILHRSAATLALDCNDYHLAEKLIAKALSNDSPPEIAEELRDLMEQVHFHRHLDLRGISLDEEEVQMSIAGSGVGFGVVHSTEFLQRVEDTSKILYRIVERRNNQPFRDKGRVKKNIKDDYELFLSVPRASSFAVTLKLGRPLMQQRLPAMSETTSIVDEFMDLMKLVNNADHNAIVERIPDVAYRTNFVHLAKRLAPDGKGVSSVGFTSLREGQQKSVQITRPRDKIVVTSVSSDSTLKGQSQRVTVKGVLRFADATHRDSGLIRIIEENGQAHNVKVPEGMMNDIVKPLWDTAVIVTGIRKGKSIRLEDIDAQ